MGKEKAVEHMIYTKDLLRVRHSAVFECGPSCRRCA